MKHHRLQNSRYTSIKIALSPVKRSECDIIVTVSDSSFPKCLRVLRFLRPQFRDMATEASINPPPPLSWQQLYGPMFSLYCWQSHLPSESGSPTTTVAGEVTYRLTTCGYNIMTFLLCSEIGTCKPYFAVLEHVSLTTLRYTITA
jgi:hypothetical protein